MLYQEFNKEILNFYVFRSKSSFCSLSIDNAEIESVLPVAEVARFRELSSTWEPLLTEIDGIPQYFGLLGVQCYAASIMHDDGQNASDAYKIRLKQILGIEEDINLQKLFSGNKTAEPIQERIWLSAKRYLYDRFDLELQLPEKSSASGRFVQFPKSQALLTTGDLESFSEFFGEEFYQGENVPLDYFKSKVYENIQNIVLPKKAKSLLFDIEKKDRCCQQIYNYFNSRDARILRAGRKEKLSLSSDKSLRNKDHNDRIFMIVEDNVPEFFLNLGHAVERIDIFAYKALSFFSKSMGDYVLFAELDDYEAEFQPSRFCIYGRDNYIIIDTTELFPISDIIRKNCVEVAQFGSNMRLYKYRVESSRSQNYIRQFHHTTKEVRLVGGLRISRPGNYLLGYGPHISSDISYRVYQDHKFCEYLPELSPVGNYKVRVSSVKDVEFCIVPMEDYPITQISRRMGWNLKTMSPSYETFQLEGCLVIQSENRPTSRVRSWISINLGNPFVGRDMYLMSIYKALK